MPSDPPSPGSSERNLQSVIEECTEALKSHPKNSDLRLSLANALSDTGQFESAIREYDLIIRQSPREISSWHFRANAKARLGDYDAANAEYEAIYDRLRNTFTPDPFYVSWSWFLATCPQHNIRNGIRAAKIAIALCRAATEKKRPEFFVGYICLAAALAERGHFKNAIASLDKASQLVKRRTILISESRQLFSKGFQYWRVFSFPAAYWENLTSPAKPSENGRVDQKLVESSSTNLSESRLPVSPDRSESRKPISEHSANDQVIPAPQIDVDQRHKIDLATQALTPLRDDPKAIASVFESIQLPAASREELISLLQTDKTPNVDQILARQVKELRKNRGWSERRLASEVGTSQRTVQLVEGAGISCELDTLTRFAAAFGLSPRGLAFPELTPKSKPVEPMAALAAVAKKIERILPSVPGPVHKSVDGIVSKKHYPSLRVLGEIAKSLGTSVSDLLP